MSCFPRHVKQQQQMLLAEQSNHSLGNYQPDGSTNPSGGDTRDDARSRPSFQYVVTCALDLAEPLDLCLLVSLRALTLTLRLVLFSCSD